MSINRKMYFIKDRRNGNHYRPVTDLKLTYVDNKLHALFEDVTGIMIDIPWKFMEIVKI